jgi:hypothetical protein
MTLLYTEIRSEVTLDDLINGTVHTSVKYNAAHNNIMRALLYCVMDRCEN